VVLFTVFPAVNSDLGSRSIDLVRSAVQNHEYLPLKSDVCQNRTCTHYQTRSQISKSQRPGRLKTAKQEECQKYDASLIHEVDQG
jgi:hypothetical protein